MSRKKKSPKPKKIPICYPPAELGQHHKIELGIRAGPDGTVSFGAKNATQRPLDRYLSREFINQDQFNAGEKIYAQWRTAQREPRLCSDYNQRVSRQTGDAAEHIENARKNYIDALKSLGHPFSGIVIAVCLIGEDATAWAIETGRARDSGLTYLRDALDKLHEHYERIHRQPIGITHEIN